MSDGTPWGMIHKQRQLKEKEAELKNVQDELHDLQLKVLQFKHSLEVESKKMHEIGSIDDTAFKKIKQMISHL